MSPADLYHVMLAGGMQDDVVHVRLMYCSASTVIGVVIADKWTDVTGTVKIHVPLCPRKNFRNCD